jgi:hypothetical protein
VVLRVLRRSDFIWEVAMSGEEMLRLYVALTVWGLMLIGAVKVFGVRRMVGFLGAIVVVGVVVALKTLAVIAGGGRRY